MIKYNENTINDWNYGSDNIIKVYRNNAVCYYKITGGGDTPTAQTPCYAVVDDISQYSDTEFEDVFNKADEKWYKLNNLNQYEEYGVYGSGRTITYYQGKLTIDSGYEYMYSGSSWNNVGEISGSTASLPNVPFSVNYNAKNYNSNTKTLSKTSGQLVDVDAVITTGTPTVHDGYLTIASETRATISGYQTYFNRDNNNPNITIISKQRTDGNNCHMFANRDDNYNWMYRCYDTKLTLHGGIEQGQLAVTTQPVIESVRIDSNRLATYNNYTNNTSSTYSSFNYGSTNSGKFALFAGYGNSTGEWFVGDFYWVYMSQNTLTDDQVQQVIAYNEGGGGEPTYPMYYDEIQDPPDNVSFSSMTEAEEYECPYVGLNADIDGTDYIFDENYDWVTKYQWATVSGYVCVGSDKYSKIEKQQRNVDDTWTSLGIYSAGTLIESASTDCSIRKYEYIKTVGTNETRYMFNTNFYPTTANTIEIKLQMNDSSVDWGAIFGWSSGDCDSCDSTQYRFTTVASDYALIARKGNTSGIKYKTIGSNIDVTCVIPINASSWSYTTGTSTTSTSVGTNVGTFTSPSTTPLHLFSIGNSGGKKSMHGRIYYVKVYDRGGNLVKHYVPSDNNGTPCFYELINGDYILDTYTGSNHGTLTLGNQI